MWKEGDRVMSKSFKMIEGSTDTLEEHTSYKCAHCDFSFKASYVGKYHLNTEKPLANTEIDNSRSRISFLFFKIKSKREIIFFESS